MDRFATWKSSATASAPPGGTTGVRDGRRQISLRRLLVACLALGMLAGLFGSQVVSIVKVYRSVAWLEGNGVQVASDFTERYGLHPLRRHTKWRALLEWSVATPDDVVILSSNPGGTPDLVPTLGSLKTVRRLNLAGSRISSQEVERLAALEALEALLLAGTAIDDRVVGSLQSLPQLQSLDLSVTNISDAALPQIARIESLKWVNLHNTKVSDEGLRKLRQARPDLVVLPGTRKQRSALLPIATTEFIPFEHGGTPG